MFLCYRLLYWFTFMKTTLIIINFIIYMNRFLAILYTFINTNFTQNISQTHFRFTHTITDLTLVNSFVSLAIYTWIKYLYWFDFWHFDTLYTFFLDLIFFALFYRIYFIFLSIIILIIALIFYIYIFCIVYYAVFIVNFFSFIGNVLA